MVLGPGRQGTAAAIAERAIKPGVIELENAMTGTEFVSEAAKRGFQVQLEVRETSHE